MVSKSGILSSELSRTLSHNSPPSSSETGPDAQEQLLVLSKLIEAAKYASNCSRSVWDFSVEVNVFTQQGVSRSLLRWLVCNHYIEHRYEAENQEGERRQFSEAPDLAITENSCFAIAESGHEAFGLIKQRCKIGQQSTSSQTDPSNESALESALPDWCPNNRILKIDGKIVKHFKWPAPNQEKLICAFAEQGWPSHLEDPLPPNGVCPKQRLHDTIKCLNRNQVNKLIKFRGDGTGQGVRWEYRPVPSPNK